MKPTTLLGTLVLLTTWSSVGVTEAGTYSFQKADNCIEQRIAAARSDDGWSLLLKPELQKPMDISAWGNGHEDGLRISSACFQARSVSSMSQTSWVESGDLRRK